MHTFFKSSTLRRKKCFYLYDFDDPVEEEEADNCGRDETGGNARESPIPLKKMQLGKSINLSFLGKKVGQLNTYKEFRNVCF